MRQSSAPHRGWDRGQTAHDFALGMGVFLLTVTIVFSTLPTIAVPYSADVTPAERVRADRVADSVRHHLSVEGDSTRLAPSKTATFFVDHPNGSALRRFVGHPTLGRVNVSIRNEFGVVRLPVDGGSVTPLAAGDPIRGRTNAQATRTVALDADGACEPACRLVVVVG